PLKEHRLSISADPHGVNSWRHISHSGHNTIQYSVYVKSNTGAIVRHRHMVPCIELSDGRPREIYWPTSKHHICMEFVVPIKRHDIFALLKFIVFTNDVSVCALLASRINPRVECNPGLT